MIKDNVNLLLNQGLHNLQRGNLGVAEEAFHKLLKFNPKHPDALHLLGVIANKQGNNKEAVRLIKKAIKIMPRNAIYYRNIGLVFMAMGRRDDAIYAFKKSIRLDHKDSDSHNDIGVIYSGLGKIEDAVREYKNAIKIDPENYQAFNNLGNDFVKLGCFDEAADAFDSAIELNPDFFEAYNGRGNVLTGLGRLESALESYDKAIHIKPDFAEAYNNRGVILQELGDLEKAMESYDKAIQLKPDHAGAYNNRGFILKERGQIERSLESYNKAIKINPDFAEAYHNQGNALKESGKIEQALVSYEKEITLKPDFAIVYRHIGSVKTYKKEDPQIRLMENMRAGMGISSSDRMQLSFALSKAYDDLGEYGKSFSCLEEGNQIRAKELAYSIDVDKRLFSKIKEIFSAEELDLVLDGDELKKHIFIVGMPRSGTSLVEHILASHRNVYGAGELEVLGRVMNPVVSRLIEKDTVELSIDDMIMVRNSYVNELELLEINEGIVSDKMPLNFRWIGFILLMFPTAKIIHLNRDPIATCWSIYKHFFSVNGNGYAYNMHDLTEFYKLYIDLMSFWRERFPGRLYDISYEELTENQEEETRALLDFSGLEWDEHCLDFHKTKRLVKTASSVQVRKKMYKGSSDAWRKYEDYLQPLISALNR